MKKLTLAVASFTLAFGSVYFSARAEVVVFSGNLPQTVTNNSEQYFGNISLGNATFVLGSTTPPSFGIGINNSNFYSTQNNGSEWAYDATVTSPDGYIYMLSANATISSTAFANWSSTGPYFSNASGGPWISGGNAYAGLRMDAGGGNYNYGWVSINYDSTAHTATISQFAFESSLNTAISAGVPEPATCGLIAAGLALLAYSHKRNKLGGL